MNFLVDQNLPVIVAAFLVAEDHQAQHTSEVGLERASDEGVFEWCRENDAVLLTVDKRLTKYLATQRASSPSVVIFRGYALQFEQLITDLRATLDAIEEAMANVGHAVFSMGPDRPTRAQRLPLVSEIE